MSFELSSTERMFAEVGRRLMDAAIAHPDFDISQRFSVTGSKLTRIGTPTGPRLDSITMEDLEVIRMVNTL